MFNLKKTIGILFVLITYDAFAVNELDLYKAPMSSLNHFFLKHPRKKTAYAFGVLTAEKNTLQQVSRTQDHSQVTTRYQQMYRGIPVIGAQIMIENAHVNGHLLDDIQLNTLPALNPRQAIDIAKKSWFRFNVQMPTEEEFSEVQIRATQNNELRLIYQVSFKTTLNDNKPSWPFFIVDAQSGEITKQWDNIKNYRDSGPGGNEKVHEYWYGKDGLPYLEVMQEGAQCIMDTPKVKLVNLASAWDWNDLLTTAFQYPCNNNPEENINGAYSPSNDAYYFGHIIVDMYREWYGVHALQNPDGTLMQLVMRVHFGENYDNAFWDGQFMSFGDGQNYYPLVSLEIAGHEVTHGFTEQHSGLEYHDQSGALDESLSDMAGQAARAYLLEQFPLFYNKLYMQADTVTWGIGETIVRDALAKALRFMDFPSSDGSSAECLDKKLAQSHGAYCAFSYPELLVYAKLLIANPQQRQNFIVHAASGIFNKAFYLLSQNIGIKKTYEIMIMANSKYWTPTTDFVHGACGVLYAAKELSVNQEMIKSVFAQVGVNTAACI